MVFANLRWNILLFGGLLALVSSIIFSYSVFGRAGLEAVSIVATTFLTLALVLLYKKQHDALRYQQEPHLEISDIEIYNQFQAVNIDISNFGGGAATALNLKICLHELNGEGPIRTVQGKLRRIESIDEGYEEKTRSSSIRPSELNIHFEVSSKTVLPMGGRSQGQKSLAAILSNELDKQRDVIYGKIIVEYNTKFSPKNKYVADFSLKFTKRSNIEYEPMEFLPWEEENLRNELGG